MTDSDRVWPYRDARPHLAAADWIRFALARYSAAASNAFFGALGSGRVATGAAAATCGAGAADTGRLTGADGVATGADTGAATCLPFASGAAAAAGAARAGAAAGAGAARAGAATGAGGGAGGLMAAWIVSYCVWISCSSWWAAWIWPDASPLPAGCNRRMASDRDLRSFITCKARDCAHHQIPHLQRSK